VTDRFYEPTVNFKQWHISSVYVRLASQYMLAWWSFMARALPAFTYKGRWFECKYCFLLACPSASTIIWSCVWHVFRHPVTLAKPRSQASLHDAHENLLPSHVGRKFKAIFHFSQSSLLQNINAGTTEGSFWPFLIFECKQTCLWKSWRGETSWRFLIVIKTQNLKL